MANNLQYILRPRQDSSTPYTRVSSAFQKGLNEIAARRNVIMPSNDYIRTSRRASDVMPHGQWYKPSDNTRRREDSAIEESNWNKKIDEGVKNYDYDRLEAELFEEATGAKLDVDKYKEWKIQQEKEDEENRKTAKDLIRQYEETHNTLDKISDVIGLLAQNSSDGGINESFGRIALAEQEKKAANAWLYTQYVKALEQQKSGTFVDGSIDYDQIYKEATKMWQQYKKDGYTEKDIAELARYYRDKTNQTSIYGKALKEGRNVYNSKIYDAAKQYQRAGVDLDFDHTKLMSQKIKDVNDYIKEKDEDIADENDALYKDHWYLPSKIHRKQFWQNVYNVNDQAREISDKAGSLKWNDPDYWIWSQATQYGYSVSSGAGIIGQALMPVSLLAGVLGASGGAAGSALAYNAINTLAVIPNYLGGVSENYQEIADKWGDNIAKNLKVKFGKEDLHDEASIKDLQKQAIENAMKNGLSAKSAKQMYDITNDLGLNNVLKMLGAGQIKTNDVRINSAIIGADKGLQQQFMADNVRTMGDEAIQWVASSIDITKFAGKIIGIAASALGGRKLLDKISSTALGKLVKESVVDGASFMSRATKYANSKFTSRAAEYGRTASDVIGGGVLGRGVGTLSGMAAASTLRGAGHVISAITPQKMKNGVALFAQAAANKMEALGGLVGAKKLKRWGLKEMAKHPTATGIAKYLGKYGYANSRAFIADHFSEGNEELVQYINSKEDFAKTYGYDVASMSDLIWDDFKKGGQVAKFYMAAANIGESELYDDIEARQNWAGGFWMGGMHPTSAVNLLYNGYGMRQQIRTDQAIAASTIVNRAAAQNSRANNQVLVDAVSRGHYDEAMNTLNDMQRRDQRRAERRGKNKTEDEANNDILATQEFWEERKRNLQHIQMLINNKHLNKQLEAQGIFKGTREYNIAIADMANMQQSQMENNQEAQEHSGRLDYLYGQQQYRDQLEHTVRDVNARMLFDDADRAVTEKQKYIDDYVKSKTKEGDTEEKIAEYRKEAEEKAKNFHDDFRENITATRRRNIVGYSKAVNRLKALLDLKSQMNTMDDWFNFAKNKLGLWSSRPDARILSKSIDDQIKEVRSAISQYDENFSTESSDEEALKYVTDATEVVGYNNQDIHDEEKFQAIYRANTELTSRQMAAMTDGVIVDNDQYSYNPDEAAYRRRERTKRLTMGDKYKEDKEHKVSEPKDPKQSYAYKRAKAIGDAQDRNAALDWFLADVSAGDAVTNLTEEEIGKQEKEANEMLNNLRAAQETPNVSEESSQEQEKPKNKAQSRLAKNAEEFQRRRQQVKEQHRRAKRKRRGRARASFVFGLDNLIEATFSKLVEQAKIGFYKFEQLYNDIQAIIEEQGYNREDKSALALAKALYIRHYLNSTKAEKENLTTPLDVQAYGSQVATIASQNITFQAMRDKLDKLQKNTIFSSYHVTIARNEEGELDAFYNPNAVDRIRQQQNYSDIYNVISTGDREQILTFLDQNEERFRNANYIAQIDEILQSKNKDKLLEGFASYLASIDLFGPVSPSIETGNTVRQLAQEIMLGNDDVLAFRQLLGNANGFDEVVANIKNLRQRMLTSGNYRVLNTSVPIYGYDAEGNAMQRDADLVLVDNDGKILLIDVRTSASPYLKERTFSGQKLRNGKTLLQEQQEHLTQASQVLMDVFGSEIEGTMILAITADPYHSLLRYETVYKIDPFDFNRPVTPYYNKTNTDISNEYVAPLQERVNTLCDEINQIYDDLNNYGENNTHLNIQIFNPNSTKAELLLQIRELHNKTQDLLLEKEQASQRLQDILNQKAKQPAEPTVYPEDVYLHEDLPEDYKIGLYELEDASHKLDDLLSSTTDLHVTTADERQKINDIISAIYDVQNAIDNVYKSEQFNRTELLEEQKLIVAAINKLASNIDNYSDKVISTLQWWQTQFASSLYNENTALFYKLKTYVDTFNEDFLNSLVGNKPLQRFWHGIFNTHLPKIIDAVRNLPQSNPTLASAMEQNAQEAESLIQKFNYRFPVDPNEDDVLNLDSAQSINDIDVQWRESHSDTTKHFPSFLSMQNPAYFSIALDPFLIQKNADGKVGQAQLVEHNGEICLKITSSSGKSIYMSFDQGNDAGPKGIDQRYFHRKLKSDAAFTQKVKYMLDFVKKNPGYHISFTISRSKGSIKNGVAQRNVTDFLFAGELNKHNLYEITCNKDNRIGILMNRVDPNTGQISRLVHGGRQLLDVIDGFDLEYIKNTSITQSGNVVYFYDTGQIEKSTTSRCIGVPLVSPKFTPGQGGMANKIADLLWYRVHNGQTQLNGLNIDDLLKMVLYIKDDKKVLSEKYNSIQSMVTLDPINQIVYIGAQPYMLRNNNDYSNLYNALCNMYISKDSNFMQQTMSQYIQDSGNSVLARLQQAYASNPNMDKVELANGLVFTREDFTHNGVGTTGLGYLLRNGYLTSAAQKLSPPVVYVDDVQIVQDSPDTSAQAAADKFAKISVEEQKKSAEDAFSMLFYEAKNYKRRSEKPSFADRVDEWVHKTVGITPEWKEMETLPDVAYNKGASVLAKCTESAIILSNSVPYTVGFHEAFHRALELLMEPSVREQMYEMYKDSHSRTLSDREVAEGLADMFVAYMEGTKDAREIKKSGWLKQNIKKLASRFTLILRFGLNDSKIILNMFNDIRSGKYNNETVSKEQEDRFKSLFHDGLHYEINGRQFNHIGTAADKEHMAKALGYIIVKSAKTSQDIYDAIHESSDLPIKYIPLKVINKLIGEPGATKPVLNWNYMSQDAITPEQKAFREVFYAELNDEGDVVFPNFQAISKEVQKYLTEIMDAYDGKYSHNEDVEDSESSENEYGKAIERYDKSAFEFSKLESVSKPVKFFFATIPYYTFDNDGKLQVDTSKNKFGIPTFMPLKEVYNMACSEFSDITTPEELLKRLEKKSHDLPMYLALYQKYKDLYDSVYQYDSEGQLRHIDYDKEALMVQIFSSLKGHEHKFIIGRSFRSNEGGVEVKISDANYDRDARAYPQLWSTFLSSGQTGLLGQVIPNSNRILLNGQYSAFGKTIKPGTTVTHNAFKTAATFLGDLAREIQNDQAITFKILGRDINAASNSDIEFLKMQSIMMLNTLGINITMEVLNHMLSTQYGGIGRDGVKRWLGSNPVKEMDNANKIGISQFLEAVGKAVQNDGYTTQTAIDNIFSTGFVSNLGNAAGAYMKITTDKMTNGMDGTKLYNMSQNNSISNTTENLNTRDKSNPLVDIVLKSSYNIISRNGIAMGSIVAKMLNSGQDFHINIATPIGFKSDNRGDNGAKYSELAEAEDYINKFAMAQAGYCVFPTLADKGTYMVLDGIPIPGMHFSILSDGSTTVANVPTVAHVYNEAGQVTATYLRPSDAVLSQFIQYAYTEREAILDCREQLGLKVDNPKGLKVLSEEEKIANYHTKSKRGLQFNSLTTLRVPQKDGSVKKFKMRGLSSDEQIKIMDEQFFSKSPKEQNVIMSLTLQEQYNEEIKKAVSLGLVSMENGQLTNVSLNSNQILAVENKILEQLKNDPSVVKDATKLQKQAHNLAIAAVLQDVTNRTVIASEEMLRLYIGNPGFFKNVEDIQKRIGGLASTGEDNCTSLPGISDSYTCAEVKDYEIASNSEIMKTLKSKMIEGELREVYGNKFGFGEVDNMKISDVRQLLVESIGEDRVKRIETTAAAYYESYTGGINVADGASYITADFCKRMLRAGGKLTDDVKKAFDVLQGEDAYSWMDKKEAYKLIYEKTNLVATKYTAYGFRPHTANGARVSDLAVPYYNKFALFPIFECLATGPLKTVYDKMKQDKVDNLLMTSAVKVGLQGASEFNGRDLSKPLTTYTQRLSALRKQLNTDPEEGDQIAAGTQMIKVCLSSLRIDRPYKLKDGTTISGKQLRDQLMGAINALSLKGVQKFRDRFYKNGILDQKKLSQYLIEQLGTRNANKNLIDALSIDPATGKMRAPIAATSDASWMESMLISAANKDIINIMTPGSSFIQRSVFGMEGVDGEGVIKGDDKLQMINEKGSMDAMISIDYFEDILPKGLSFNQAKQWLIDHNIIGKNAEANTIGYRIPTQAQSSIHALRFVDVIPAVKSTVILPAEFTKITGSDFDIDHLYLARYNVNDNGGYEFEEGTTEQLQNTIISSILTVLQDDKSYNILYKSIDNDTALVQSIADQIPEEDNTKDMAYNFGTLHEQVTRKNDYITGKIGIGPFALNVTNHILTTLYGVKFKESDFTRKTGITGFNKILDENDNQISSWLSAFINAHVDIVKDPYISKLNVNGFTYNMINLLARNGKGVAGLYFLCQPIIRQMAKADIDSRSQFARNPHIYKTAYDMRQKALEKIFPDVCGIGIDNDGISDILNDTTKGSVGRKAEIVNEVLGNIEMLQKIAKDPNGFGKSAEGKQFQIKCYLAWQILDKYSNALNQLVQYTKIDTRKQGKNFLEMMSYKQNYDNLVNAEQEESLFDMDSIRDLVKLTWIDQKTRDAIEEPISVMTGQSFQGTPEFINPVIDVANTLSTRINNAKALAKNPKALKKISQAASSQIKVNYMAALAKELGINVKGLFEGNATIFDRLNALQACIQRNAYNLGRLKDNYLIKHLAPYLTDQTTFANGKLVQKPKFIQVLNSMDESKMSADMFIESWEELLSDEMPNVKNFARDLIFYAMYTSGDTKGFNKLAKYIPISYLLTRHSEHIAPFNEYIEQQLQSPSISIDGIVQNNFMDDDIVSRTTFKDFYYAANGNYAPAVMVHQEITSNMAPEYVAVRYDGAKYNDATSYTLYKHVGEINIDTRTTIKIGDIEEIKGSVVTQQVYAQIPKRGWQEKQGLTIYEYDDINLAVNGIPISQEIIDNQIDKLKYYLKTYQPIIKYKNLSQNLSWFNNKYFNPNSDFINEAQQVTEEQTVKDVTPKDVGESPTGQPVWISRQYYYKGQPQKHPNVQYMFTENLQAYIASHKLNMPAGILSNPKLNVGGQEKGNQACIRTDENGNFSPNTFGVIVKFLQQDYSGRFINDRSACFQSGQNWLDSFKSWNTYVFNSIDKSKPIVIPAQMALGKAALPRECAEWLRTELLQRFNIVSEIQENKNPGYVGMYGLSIKGVVSTERAQEILNEDKQKMLAQSGFSKEDMDEAERIKNHCKGGKQ